MTAGYSGAGPYSPTRRHSSSRRLDLAVVAAVVACVAAAVLVAAVRFRPPVFTVCTPAGPALACVTAPTPPMLPATYRPARAGSGI